MPRSPPARRPVGLLARLATAWLALHGGAALAAGPADADGPSGGPRPDRPLGVVTPGPLRALFVDPPLADARPGGEPALELRWWAANSWSIPTALERAGQAAAVQLDVQTDVLSLTGRVEWGDHLRASPLAARLATAVEARLVHHWGGWTDGPIEAWHRLGRYNTFGRPAAPSDRVNLTIGGPAGGGLALSGPATGLGDVTVRTSLRLAEGAEVPDRAGSPWAVAARLDVKLPTGRPADFTGSGGPDAALVLGASAPLLGWLTGHAQASVARVSRLPAASPLQPRPWPLAAEVSLAARAGPDWVFLLESRVQSALVERGWRLAGAPPAQGDAVTALTRVQGQSTFAVRWRGVTAWLSEDVMLGSRRQVGWRWFYDTNAPDVVIGLSLSLSR